MGAKLYENFFKNTDYIFIKEPKGCKSNYWLNSIILNNKEERDQFLEFANEKGVMTRPIWTLMNRLPMFKQAECGNLKNSEWLYDHVVNIPSSII